MAKKSKKQDAPVEKPIDELDLLSYARRAMYEYGTYTLEQRAIPDYRDGLKPIHRRILYAGYDLGMLASRKEFKKSARLVGEVLGKYHPHGDKAAYDTAVGMTRRAFQLMEGQGNFGTLLDGPAAMRYTEIRVSDFAEAVYFNRDYNQKGVIDMVPNFDGKELEPVVLNAVLPAFLLVGQYGIAMGATMACPAFDLPGVAELTKKAINGKDVTVKDCMKHLVPVCYEGGTFYLDDSEPEIEENLKAFYATGQGFIYWVPECEVFVADRTLRVSGFTPALASKGLDKILEAISKRDDILRIDDSECQVDPDGQNSILVYNIILRNTVPKNEVEDTLWEISSYFEGNQKLSLLITERNYDAENAKVNVDVFPINMPEFFKRWSEWRIGIERRMLQFKIERDTKELNYQELMLLAVLNREVIIKALDADDSHAVLVKKLKITHEQADIILQLRVIQLKKMGEKPIRDKISKLKAAIKGWKASHKSPQADICASIDELTKEFAVEED